MTKERKTRMPSKHSNFQCQQHPKCSAEEFPSRSSSSGTLSHDKFSQYRRRALRERDFHKSKVDRPLGDRFQKKSLITTCVLLISVVVPPGRGLNQRVWKGRHLNLGPHVCTPKSLTCSVISLGPPNTFSFVKYENFRAVYTVTIFILLKVTKAITHIGSSLG